MTNRRAHPRGFTIVELMIAVTIFAIGMTGIIALQQVTVVANKHARNLSIASHIAATWIDQLAADATLWTLAGYSNTVWIDQGAPLAGQWFRPTWDEGRSFGAAFDAHGNPLSEQNAAQAAFCANVAVKPLYRSAGPNGVMRVEVRVFWLRDTGAPDAPRLFCAIQSTPKVDAATITSDAAADPNIYHFVHETSAVRQQP